MELKMFKGKGGVALGVTFWTFCFRVCEMDEMPHVQQDLCRENNQKKDGHLGRVADVVLPSTFEE